MCAHTRTEGSLPFFDIRTDMVQNTYIVHTVKNKCQLLM